jgi:hypothetical protein
MSDESEWLRPLLARVYGAKWAEENLSDFESLQERFVFHMVDAASELRRLSDLLGREDRSPHVGWRWPESWATQIAASKALERLTFGLRTMWSSRSA